MDCRGSWAWNPPVSGTMKRYWSGTFIPAFTRVFTYCLPGLIGFVWNAVQISQNSKLKRTWDSSINRRFRDFEHAKIGPGRIFDFVKVSRYFGNRNRFDGIGSIGNNQAKSVNRRLCNEGPVLEPSLFPYVFQRI